NVQGISLRQFEFRAVSVRQIYRWNGSGAEYFLATEIVYELTRVVNMIKVALTDDHIDTDTDATLDRKLNALDNAFESALLCSHVVVRFPVVGHQRRQNVI